MKSRERPRDHTQHWQILSFLRSSARVDAVDAATWVIKGVAVPAAATDRGVFGDFHLRPHERFFASESCLMCSGSRFIKLKTFAYLTVRRYDLECISFFFLIAMHTAGNAIPEPHRAHRCTHASPVTSGMAPSIQPTGLYPLKTAPGSPTTPTTGRARMHESAYYRDATNKRQIVALGGSGGGRARPQLHQQRPRGPYEPHASSRGRRRPI